MRDRQDHKDRATEIINDWLDEDPQRTSVLVERITDAIEEAWTAALRSFPLPAPTPVEEAERAVVEYAVRRWSHAAALGSEALDHIERQDDARLVQAVADLLAARQQEKEARDAP